MGTREAAEKWGCSQATVSRLCRMKKIPRVEQDAVGSPWRIPTDTEKPNSIRSGK